MSKDPFPLKYSRMLLKSSVITSRSILYPHSTGRRFRYAHGDHGVSLILFQIAAEA